MISSLSVISVMHRNISRQLSPTSIRSCCAYSNYNNSMNQVIEEYKTSELQLFGWWVLLCHLGMLRLLLKASVVNIMFRVVDVTLVFQWTLAIRHSPFAWSNGKISLHFVFQWISSNSARNLFVIIFHAIFQIRQIWAHFFIFIFA